jgi:hypothetical protein
MKMDIIDLSTGTDEDLLTEIFKLQLELQRRYHPNWDFMTIEEQVEYLKYNALAIAGETAEAMAEVGWKPWARSVYIDRDPFVGELIDMSKFLFNMMLRVGVTPQEFAQRFRGKTVVNHTREDDGYDGKSTKCACGRALDEPKAVSS